MLFNFFLAIWGQWRELVQESRRRLLKRRRAGEIPGEWSCQNSRV